jgi:mono/diheme cytochrome c family protein
MRSLAVAVIAVSVAATAAAAQTRGDAASGRALAEEVCARCHDISPDAPLKAYPPSFRAIATVRFEEQIRARIMVPIHTGMPDLGLVWEPGKVDDLVAYIVTLDAE